MIFQNIALTGLAATSLSISILIVLFLPLRRLLRRYIGSEWLCLLWLAFLFRLLVPWPFESRFGLVNIWHQPPAHSTTDETWKIKAGGLENDGPKNTPANSPSRAMPAALPSKNVSLNLWGLAWLSGVIFSLGILVWRWNQTRQLGRATRPATDKRLLNIYASIPEKWRRGVELRVADSLQVPTLAGIFRSQIWMPSSWPAGFTDTELRNILLHEIGHARRGDLMVQWLFALVQCVHWFNPLVWIAARAAHFDREMACDAWVLARTDAAESPVYGATLLKAMGLLRSPLHSAPGAVAMASGRKSLCGRISGISTFQRTPAWRGAAGVVIMVVALAAGTTSHSTAEEKTSPPASPAASPQAVVAFDSKGEPIYNGPFVKVETKFIQITESAWKKLCAENEEFESLSPKFPELAHEKISFEALPGKVTYLEQAAWQISNGINVLSLLSRGDEENMIKTLNGRDGVEFLSAPSLTTRNNQRAVIEIIREFRYPSVWEPDAKSPTGYSPVEFTTQNNGITLEAEPSLTLDGPIELQLVPKVETFLGFLEEKDRKKMMQAGAVMKSLVRPVFSISRGKVATVIHADRAILMGCVRLDHKEIGNNGKAGSRPSIASLAGHTDAAPETVRHILLIFVTAEVVNADHTLQPSPSPGTKPSHVQNADQKIPYGIAVEGKAGFVTSPFAPGAGAVDVRGFSRDTEVKDPYTGKMFLVP